ncbi:MAG: hypothetical protein BAJALOKI3v1_190032 [Promethearchaeota archaeon]|nr:MAG: hypothetical protein BAJALOKI3v1_190032 [Candidatus Lokiarchaeota archaeon]
MIHFDFDSETQDIFNEYYFHECETNWEQWLKISNKEEYLDLCLKNSGLDCVNDIFDKIRNVKTNSRQFSVDLESFLASWDQNFPPILCHTSGTTNNNPQALKWFHMSESIIKSLWVPGMEAIFESSGLNSSSSAVIFVPSRMKFDGINEYKGEKYLALYSSEFSQRLVVSQLRPKSYILYPYKDVYNLEVLSSILNLESIAIISAPAATLLKWADISRLKSGIQQYLSNLKKNKNYHHSENKLIKKVVIKGLDNAVREIQKDLSMKFSKSVAIFSISSLDPEQWNMIRDFMHWTRGNERFTNLYVGSEIGPFASSLPKDNFQISKENKMYVLPLTLPALEYRDEIKPIHQFESNKGRLLISRNHDYHPLLNIDTGDVISLLGHNSLPIIKGDILRGEFKLKYNVKINKNIDYPPNPVIKAGNFLTFDKFVIFNSQTLYNCINQHCSLNGDSLVLVESIRESSRWKFIVPTSEEKCVSKNEIENIILNCPDEPELKDNLRNGSITIDVFDKNIISFLEPRSEVLEKVRKGLYPKGILKKWPLYVVKTKN